MSTKCVQKFYWKEQKRDRKQTKKEQKMSKEQTKKQTEKGRFPAPKLYAP